MKEPGWACSQHPSIRDSKHDPCIRRHYEPSDSYAAMSSSRGRDGDLPCAFSFQLSQAGLGILARLSSQQDPCHPCQA